MKHNPHVITCGIIAAIVSFIVLLCMFPVLIGYLLILGGLSLTYSIVYDIVKSEQRNDD